MGLAGRMRQPGQRGRARATLERWLVLIVAAALVAAACSSAEKPAATPANADPQLESALHAYVVEFLKRYPTTNTYLGGAGFDPALRNVDGTLRDYRPAAIDAEDQWLAATKKTLEAFDAASLSPSARIDRDVALAQIAFTERQHSLRRYQERALDTYVSEPFRALDWQLQGMTATGDSTYGSAEEWGLVTQRVAAIPQFLEGAREQLTRGTRENRTPDRRMLERDGLNTSEANAKYFGETLPALAAQRIMPTDRERLLPALRAACTQAAVAYADFRTFVLETFFEAGKPTRTKSQYAADRFAMGEGDYNWALKNNFRLDKTAAELFDESWPIVRDTERQMIELAQRVGHEQSWTLPADGGAAVRTVFDQLSKDYPKSDAVMIQWYRDAAFKLVEYARKTGLFDVPADYKLDVFETPPPLQASIDGAAYYPAPPFKNTGVGRFYVTPTHNDVAALQANNRAALADLAAHEGFPGHDWYFKILTGYRDQVSPVRWLTPGAVEDSSSMWQDSMPAEGWGLYAEALMGEPQPGAPNGFYSPAERLYQLQGKLYRDLRVRIDTGIHTGRMTYDDATSLYSEVVDFLPGRCPSFGDRAQARATLSSTKRASCEAAERAIFRYSKWPTQAITYRLGKDQIYALREAAAKARGDGFSPKTFHLEFIRQGTIPAGYFRDELMKQLKAQQ